MNMHSNIKHTAAEEVLLNQLSESSNNSAAGALEMLSERGLPTRKVEPWHYTDLRTLLRDYPHPPSAIQSEFSGESLKEMSDLAPGFTIGFSNTSHLIGAVKDLPECVTGEVGPAAANTTHEVEIAADTVGVLNSALAENGAVLNVAPGAKVDGAITLAHTCAGATASVLRHSVTIGEEAEALFIERHHSSTIENHENVVCNLKLEKGAKATWVISQELGQATTRLGQFNFDMAEGAELNILVLNAGGKLVRQEIHGRVRGENANLAIKGVNLIGEGAHIDVTTTLSHEVPHTTAEELFRNVVTGHGKGVFQGQIRVAQPAQKTDAQMACNSLLLSDDSDFSAKPELEIFADDVVCAHGATVTDIDEDHLFYMRARGIAERDSRALLVKAFVDEVFEETQPEALGESLIEIIETWLDANA